MKTVTRLNAVSIASIADLEAEARGRLDRAVYDFFAGGADAEVTLKANEEAFGLLALVPRVLRPSAWIPRRIRSHRLLSTFLSPSPMQRAFGWNLQDTSHM